MRIDPADAEAPKFPGFNQADNLLMGCGKGRRERVEIAQDARTVLQVATRQFTQNERMHHDQGLAE